MKLVHWVPLTTSKMMQRKRLVPIKVLVVTNLLSIAVNDFYAKNLLVVTERSFHTQNDECRLKIVFQTDSYLYD